MEKYINQEDNEYIEESREFIKRLNSKDSKTLQRYVQRLSAKNILDYAGILLFNPEKATRLYLAENALESKLKKKN